MDLQEGAQNWATQTPVTCQHKGQNKQQAIQRVYEYQTKIVRKIFHMEKEREVNGHSLWI